MMLKAFTLAAVVAVSSADAMTMVDFCNNVCVPDCQEQCDNADDCTTSTGALCYPQCEYGAEICYNCERCSSVEGFNPYGSAGPVDLGPGLDIADLLDSVGPITDIADLIGPVSSTAMNFNLSALFDLSAEGLAAMVEQAVGGMTEDMPDAMRSILEGPLNKLKTDKELFGKFMTMMMNDPCNSVSQSCTNGVCTCTGDADCCIDMERDMERSMCQSKCEFNGEAGCMDACGNDDDDFDLSDPMLQKMFDLLGVDMNEAKAAKAVMELETQKSLVTAAKEALKAAGCSGSRGRRDAVQCGLDCATKNAGDLQATATCVTGCANAVGVDLNAVSGIDLSDVGGNGNGGVDCAALEKAVATAESALADHIAAASSAFATTASLAVAAVAAAAMFL